MRIYCERVKRLFCNEWLAFQGLKKHFWIRRKNLKKEPLKVYWWAGLPNFGDLFNPEIIKEIFGYNCVWTLPDECSLAGAGSILAIVKNSNAYVWGSGLIEEDPISQNSMVFYAVRGELTRERIGKKWANVALGDPGLLANLIYKKSELQTGKIGVIPHYVDRDLPIISRINNDDRFLVINVSDPPASIASSISQCRLVLSSSLHGLIFADSFSIPNIHIKLSDSLTGGLFKFFDYYSAIGKDYRQADIGKIFNDVYLSELHSTYKPIRNLKAIQRKLINAFPY